MAGMAVCRPFEWVRSDATVPSRGRRPWAISLSLAARAARSASVIGAIMTFDAATRSADEG